MKYGGVVYIMTNKRNGTLYTGVTSDLRRRVREHRTKADPDSFTAKYTCSMLVYYGAFPRIEDAITEEKRIKSSRRKAKIKLIETMNPQWKDLWEEIKAW
jgi:putative endonuclease